MRPRTTTRAPDAPGETGAGPGVRRLYEALPYPARDPADEDRRLIEGTPSHLAELDHWLFGGRLATRVQSRPLRVLVAGGGTGDATVMMAQQAATRGWKVEILHLDLSEASLAIARARIARRRLGGVTFRRGSLFDAQPEAPFDYVDCCGVLHHLPDPDAGLAALTAQLAADGGIGLMLYGRYGRRGVYEGQDLLRRLLGVGPIDSARVAAGRAIVAALPDTNPLKQNRALLDPKQTDDADFADLLLHPQDRAYTVPEVLALVSGTGLTPVAFLEPVLYRPETFLREPVVAPRLAALPEPERWAVAELAAGMLAKHKLYARRAEAPACPPPDPADPSVVAVVKTLALSPLVEALVRGERPTFVLGPLRVTPPLGREEATILGDIDGRTSLAGIAVRLALRDPTWTQTRVMAGFARLWEALAPLNFLVLRH